MGFPSSIEKKPVQSVRWRFSSHERRAWYSKWSFSFFRRAIFYTHNHLLYKEMKSHSTEISVAWNLLSSFWNLARFLWWTIITVVLKSLDSFGYVSWVSWYYFKG
jgi:hypothetical protein